MRSFESRSSEVLTGALGIGMLYAISKARSWRLDAQAARRENDLLMEAAESNAVLIGLLFESNGRHRRDALHDKRTGLLNEAGLEEVFAAKRESRRRDTDQSPLPLYAAFVDLDEFKVINDTYGHDMGNAALISVADVLKESIRADSGDVVGRLHGDEFLAFLHGVTHEESQLVAERIRQNINDMHDIKPDIIPTVTIGLTPVTACDTFESMKTEADKAMYVAKEAGRNQVHFLDR